MAEAKGREQGKAASGARTAGGTLRIKQIGSLIGCTDRQRATVRGLGLRRMHHVVERQDTPEIRGMVKAVPHLVAVVE
jgi:large subunit ribosomal protein L30